MSLLQTTRRFDDLVIEGKNGITSILWIAGIISTSDQTRKPWRRENPPFPYRLWYNLGRFPMRRKDYFKNLDFNKEWTEEDWEEFFQLQDEYFAQKLDPTLILRLRNRSAKHSFLNLERALSELGLQSDIPVVKELQNKSFFHRELDSHLFANPIHVSKEGASLEDLPIFVQASQFAHILSQDVDKMNKRKRAQSRTRRIEIKGEPEALKLHACWTGVNIALGHKIGYDPDSIRGNVAKCKRALKHANACVGLLTQVSRRSKSSKMKRDLFSQSVRLRNNISNWIENLRMNFDTRRHG